MPVTKPRISKPRVSKPRTAPGKTRLTSGLARIKRAKKW